MKRHFLSNRSANFPVNETSIKECQSQALTMEEATSASYQSIQIVSDIPAEHMTYEASISVILMCCKKRILYPYLRLISILGWRPLFFSAVEPPLLIRLLNVLYPIFVIVIIFAGHSQDYLACHMDIIEGLKKPRFLHFLPSLFHLAAYIMVLYYSRTPESERLETLMERVFLQSSRNAGWLICHKQLMKKLRNFFWFYMIWVIVSLTTRLLQFYLFDPVLSNAWICDYDTNNVFNTIRIACSTWNDVVCAAIVTTYSVHCQLNISFIQNLCTLIRERRVTIQEFFKKVEEGRNFIEYLNNDQAVGVSLIIMNLICRCGLALITLLHPPPETPLNWKGISVLCFLISTQLVLMILNFRQALRLTDACKTLRSIGHELRSMHSSMSLDHERSDLDSLVLYTSSLNLNAKLLQIPIKPSFVSILMISLTFSILLLAQFEFINF